MQRRLGATVWLAALIAVAAVPIAAQPAAIAGPELTPVGAIRDGNADRSIPPWEGGLTAPPAGWQRSTGYPDPFPDDKPLFVITAANANQYAARLAPGLLALLRQYSQFRMPVYPTRRTAVFPREVLALATAPSRAAVKGFGITNPDRTNIPFPVPKSGLEAIWNHLVRYTGGGVERTAHTFPVRPGGDYYKIGFQSTRIYDQNMDQRTENRLFSARGSFTEPAALRGTTFLVHEPADQVTERRSAWVYNAGARRVRRAPDLGYDGINDGSEGMLTTDQVDGYNGAPDRYDWKLLGRRELYVPYNTYRIGDKKVKYAEVLGKGTMNAELMRYELHRVWVVEATLRPGMSHVYGKRVFYLDEDSWSVLIEDAYSTRGTLWRVALHGLVQFYDAQVPGYRFSVYHDLDNGSYMLGGLDNEIDEPIRFNAKGQDRDFQPSALRRIADR